MEIVACRLGHRRSSRPAWQAASNGGCDAGERDGQVFKDGLLRHGRLLGCAHASESVSPSRLTRQRAPSRLARTCTLQTYSRPARACAPRLTRVVAPLSDWISIYQKDPALFDEKETPDAKPEPEKIAFIEDLKAGRRLDAGKAILACPLPVSPRGAPTHSPSSPLSLSRLPLSPA